MNTTQRKQINIKDASLSPREIAMLVMKVDDEMSLVRVRDDTTKTQISAKQVYLATKYFNMKNARPVVDADGHEDLHGMDPNHLYHDERSLKEQGLREVSRDAYPNPYEGGSLWHDTMLWKAARELRNIEGRNWENLQIAVWQKMNEIFDMSDYNPRADEKHHTWGRMTAMQRLFFDAQNMLMQAKDQTKREVNALTTKLPRTYKEWIGLHQEMVGAVRALEMSHGKKEGSEEAETMRAMIQFQLRNENTIPYDNQAHRHAINDCLLTLQKEGDEYPELMTTHRVMDTIIMRWRSVGIGGEGNQLSAETEAKSAERILLATAKQIVEDKAKEPFRPHEPRAKGGDKDKDIIEMRRELADLRNQLNQQQQKGNGGKYQDRPYQGGGRWGGRGGQGGYDRRPAMNGMPYRGGSARGARPQIQASSREEPREAGFYVRPVGFDADTDIGGRAACRIARVKANQIFDEDAGFQYEKFEAEEMPELESSSDDEEEEECRRATRSQVARKKKEDKRRAEDMPELDATTVQLAEGLLASSAKKQRMDQMDMEDKEERVMIDDEAINPIELKRLHDEKLSAWAWGTGGAEKYEGEAREAAWAIHGESATANFIRKQDLLKQVGIDSKQEYMGANDNLLQYHLWPGPRNMDMYPLPINGSEREARMLNEYRMFKDAEDNKARMIYLKEMCRTRNLIGREIHASMHEHEARMHQDVRFWWDETQRILVWDKLDEILMEMAEDPESELRDRSEIMELYEGHIQAYMDRSGPFEMPDYDAERAREMHMHQFDFAGKTGESIMSQLKEGPVTLYTGVVVCDKTQFEQEDASLQKQYRSKVGKLMFEATQFGQKRSAKEFATQMREVGSLVTQMMDVGKGLNPDWVAPPEGIQATAGEQLGKGEHESGGGLDGGYNTRSKSRRSGAGLPIPEGCLHNARGEWENGQSSRDPGDM